MEDKQMQAFSITAHQKQRENVKTAAVFGSNRPQQPYGLMTIIPNNQKEYVPPRSSVGVMHVRRTSQVPSSNESYYETRKLEPALQKRDPSADANLGTTQIKLKLNKATGLGLKPTMDTILEQRKLGQSTAVLRKLKGNQITEPTMSNDQPSSRRAKGNGNSSLPSVVAHAQADPKLRKKLIQSINENHFLMSKKTDQNSSVTGKWPDSIGNSVENLPTSSGAGVYTAAAQTTMAWNKMPQSKYQTLYSDTRPAGEKFGHRRAGSIAIISNKTMDINETADYGEVGKIDQIFTSVIQPEKVEYLTQDQSRPDTEATERANCKNKDENFNETVNGSSNVEVLETHEPGGVGKHVSQAAIKSFNKFNEAVLTIRQERSTSCSIDEGSQKLKTAQMQKLSMIERLKNKQQKWLMAHTKSVDMSDSILQDDSKMTQRQNRNFWCSDKRQNSPDRALMSGFNSMMSTYRQYDDGTERVEKCSLSPHGKLLEGGLKVKSRYSRLMESKLSSVNGATEQLIKSELEKQRLDNALKKLDDHQIDTIHRKSDPSDIDGEVTAALDLLTKGICQALQAGVLDPVQPQIINQAKYSSTSTQGGGALSATATPPTYSKHLRCFIQEVSREIEKTRDILQQRLTRFVCKHKKMYEQQKDEADRLRAKCISLEEKLRPAPEFWPFGSDEKKQKEFRKQMEALLADRSLVDASLEGVFDTTLDSKAAEDILSKGRHCKAVVTKEKRPRNYYDLSDLLYLANASGVSHDLEHLVTHQDLSDKTLKTSELDTRLLTQRKQEEVLNALMSGIQRGAKAVQDGTGRAILKQLKPIPEVAEVAAQTYFNEGQDIKDLQKKVAIQVKLNEAAYEEIMDLKSKASDMRNRMLDKENELRNSYQEQSRVNKVLEKERQEAEKALEQFQDEKSTLQLDLSTAKKHAESILQKSITQTIRANSLDTQVREMRATNAALRAKIENWEQEIADKMEMLEEAAAKAKEFAATMEHERDKFEAEAEALKNRLESRENAFSEGESEINALKKQFEKSELYLNEAKHQIKQLKQRVEQLQDQNFDLKDKLAQRPAAAPSPEPAPQDGMLGSSEKEEELLEQSEEPEEQAEAVSNDSTTRPVNTDENGPDRTGDGDQKDDSEEPEELKDEQPPLDNDMENLLLPVPEEPAGESKQASDNIASEEDEKAPLSSRLSEDRLMQPAPITVPSENMSKVEAISRLTSSEAPARSSQKSIAEDARQSKSFDSRKGVSKFASSGKLKLSPNAIEEAYGTPQTPPKQTNTSKEESASNTVRRILNAEQDPTTSMHHAFDSFAMKTGGIETAGNSSFGRPVPSSSMTVKRPQNVKVQSTGRLRASETASISKRKKITATLDTVQLQKSQNDNDDYEMSPNQPLATEHEQVVSATHQEELTSVAGSNKLQSDIQKLLMEHAVAGFTGDKPANLKLEDVLFDIFVHGNLQQNVDITQNQGAPAAGTFTNSNRADSVESLTEKQLNMIEQLKSKQSSPQRYEYYLKEPAKWQQDSEKLLLELSQRIACSEKRRHTVHWRRHGNSGVQGLSIVGRSYKQEKLTTEQAVQLTTNQSFRLRSSSFSPRRPILVGRSTQTDLKSGLYDVRLSGRKIGQMSPDAHKKNRSVMQHDFGQQISEYQLDLEWRRWKEELRNRARFGDMQSQVQLDRQRQVDEVSAAYIRIAHQIDPVFKPQTAAWEDAAPEATAELSAENTPQHNTKATQLDCKNLNVIQRSQTSKNSELFKETLDGHQLQTVTEDKKDTARVLSTQTFDERSKNAEAAKEQVNQSTNVHFENEYSLSSRRMKHKVDENARSESAVCPVSRLGSRGIQGPKLHELLADASLIDQNCIGNQSDHYGALPVAGQSLDRRTVLRPRQPSRMTSNEQSYFSSDARLPSPDSRERMSPSLLHLEPSQAALLEHFKLLNQFLLKQSPMQLQAMRQKLIRDTQNKVLKSPLNAQEERLRSIESHREHVLAKPQSIHFENIGPLRENHSVKKTPVQTKYHQHRNSQQFSQDTERTDIRPSASPLRVHRVMGGYI